MEVKSSELYSVQDFDKVPKIDGHVHYYTTDPIFIEYARQRNMRYISINVDFKDAGWPEKEEQLAISQYFIKEAPDVFAFIGAVPMCDPYSSICMSGVSAYIQHVLKIGAIGVKIWKNVGMKLRTENRLLMIDHPEFKGLLDFLEDKKIPLLGHFGEPKNCWLPLEEMTVNSDIKYFTKNPDYHMYLHPELPGYEAQIEARDNMLRQHPDLPFVGAHLASCEWSVDEIAARLDSYPNMMVDLAERVCHLQHQCIENYDKVRQFMIDFQDRLIYASDIIHFTDETYGEQIEEVKHRWESQWHFFTQGDLQTTWQVNGEFRGLALPKEVIDKIYFHNAFIAYPRLKYQFLPA
ncbi:MAG: amidohydrolase family protein [Marinilabiliaceae bacterium]|nr:amidohydrolase family protein [Marinilabiliaceae bacterium]